MKERFCLTIVLQVFKPAAISGNIVCMHVNMLYMCVCTFICLTFHATELDITYYICNRENCMKLSKFHHKILIYKKIACFELTTPNSLKNTVLKLYFMNLHDGKNQSARYLWSNKEWGSLCPSALWLTHNCHWPLWSGSMLRLNTTRGKFYIHVDSPQRARDCDVE